MKNNIILNVDDFGLTAGVNQAVFELNRLGLIKSTTALVGSPYFKRDITRAVAITDLGVGIHLTIDLFKAEVFDLSLCDGDQNFYTAKTHDITRSLDSNIIYKEWKAQIEKFIKIAGVMPTHIDSHHHVHILNADAKIAASKLADEYNIPLRGANTDSYVAKCSEEFYDTGVNLENLCRIIDELITSNCDYGEVMIHPAVVDDELIAISSYNTKRALECEILKSKEFYEYIQSNEIVITNYTQKR